MEAALLKVVQTQQAATESQTEYARRLAATKEAAEKACAESESLMEKKVDEISKKMALLDTETQKYKQLAIEAEAARVALELKSKEEEEATKARIKELRSELLDLANDEMQLTDGMSKVEIMALLEDLIGEKVSRINRLAAVSAEFYKLQKTLHFPASDPLTPFLQTLPTNLPDNPNRRALQLRAKQIFVASLNSPSKSLPPPFAFTRAYIETLEDRRDDVRDQVMEQEAKESDCKRVVDEIAKLYENLNIPKQDRNALVLDIKNLDEYNILVQELREKWEAGKQGEVDMSRLQEFREELTDLKANEFVVKDPNSQQERWQVLENLVTEKADRINQIASLSTDLLLQYNSVPEEVHSKTPEEVQIKALLDNLSSGVQDSTSPLQLQSHIKDKLTSYFAEHHSLPKPLSITRVFIKSLQERISVVRREIKEHKEREEQLRRLISDIKELWDQLEVPESERIVLVDDLKNLKEYTAIADRLRKRWSEKMKLEIDQTVEKLKQVWKDCGTSKEEQDLFWSHCKPIYSPIALQEMKKEIASAALRRERGLKIAKLIQERQDFIKKLIEFEEAAKDPGRLTGSSIRLLEEEKFRKSALPNLKKMENVIRKQLNEYEEVSERPYYVKDRPYQEILDEEVKDRLSNSSVLVFFAKK
ncbi:carboxypeptidase C prc1 [Rhizoclosmatium sp. JEL0117]|nr:carboxypeptidase C prc1 [Rhizoclosmatium sp. JEL0117]